MSLLAAVVAISLSAAPAAEESQQATIFGLGNNSCGKWTSAKLEGGWPRIAHHAWLSGFLSGINVQRRNSYSDLTDGRDMDGMSAWVDNYCAKHPLDTVAQAGDALIVELMIRKLQRQ